MAKTKTPFLSLGAHGSVGGSITAQKRYDQTLIRTKPLPTDRYTLSQAYQRWHFQDLANLWLEQSAATQRDYSAHGAKRNLTGQQYWMKVQLPLYANLIRWFHLDETTGPDALDSSPYATNATIFGCSPVKGLISYARYFDGLNDYIDLDNAGSIAGLSAEFSIEMFLYFSSAPSSTHGIFKRAPAWSTSSPTQIEIYSDTLIINRGTNLYYCTYPAPSIGSWHHYVWTFKNKLWRHFKDGIELAVTYGSGTANNPLTGNPSFLGQGYSDLRKLQGSMDEVRFYNRALSPSEVAMRPERRYPAQ